MAEADRMWNQPSPRSVTETLIGSYMFVIQDYSEAKGIGAGKRITSDEFMAGGHKWAIYFYPNGKHKTDQSNHVSLFITLNSSESKDVKALFEFTLMDQSGRARHKVFTNFTKNLPYRLKHRGSFWGYRRFFKTSKLETSDFLRDGCLKIYITIGVVNSTLHLDFGIGGMPLENMEGSDITFNVSGEKFHAHKSILAARSTKFWSEFVQGVGAEGEEVMVQDIEPNVFKALLHFIYKDALAESEMITFDSCSAPLVADTLTAKLLAAADRYDLKRLKSICETHLCKDISVNSVAQLLALGDLYHASELKDFCLKFAAQNLQARAFGLINHSEKMADRTVARSCSVREMGKGSNLFVTEGYSMAKGIGVGKYIASDEFTMGGCKWVLYFYPNGKSGEDNLDFLSVFLSLKSEAADLPVIFEITLMDLSGKGKHKVSTCLVNSVPHTFRNGRKKWGLNRLFRRAGLETTDFLRDDCLKIYCNMSVADHDVRSERVMLVENLYSLHKDIFTGDFDPDCWNSLVPKIPAAPEIMQDDEDEAGEEVALSKLGKELMKLLLSPSNRLNDSDADDEDNDDNMEVDTYSVVVPKKQSSKQEPFDNSPLKATSSAVGCGTPSASKSSKLKRRHRGQGSKELNSAPLKKARKENELKRVKDETASSSESGATPPTGQVTEDEIKAVLLKVGWTMTTDRILARFKSRLKLKEDMIAFAATLKRIAKIEKANDLYYLVPRDDLN